MKRFVIKYLLFLSPLVILLILLELFILLTPNSFQKKADYISANLDAKVLILGSSHNQNAINPEWLDLKAINMAYGGQDIQLDSALFFKYAPSLTHLKYLVIELDYHTLEHKNLKNYFRFSWYYRYHNIKVVQLPFYYRFLIYPSSPSFFNDYIIRKLNPSEVEPELNEAGFALNSFEGDFLSLNHNTEKINASAKKRLVNKHTFPSKGNYIFNTKKINNIINYCNSNGIKVIMVSTPLYETYIKNQLNEKKKRQQVYINEVIQRHANVVYLDYENDNRFVLTDFKNDDHLNPTGATKFTKILNQYLNTIQHKKEN